MRSTARLVVLATLAAAMAFAGCVARPVLPEPAATAEVTILHVNDPHGHLEPYTAWGKSVGGYARLATMVDHERAAGKAARVFLLHAGDEFSRGDDLTQATHGAANLAVMNRLKFDAWTPGNGDFYGGAEDLQARIRQAAFPVLVANVGVRAGGARLGRPYVIERAGPVRIAFLGLCFVQPREEASYVQFAVDDPIETARRLVPEIRSQADVVVVVSHLGLKKDGLLARTVEGIDVIVGAHTHDLLEGGFREKGPDGRDVLIAQAGEQLLYLGRVDLKLGLIDGAWRVVSAKASVRPVDDKWKLDPSVTALIARLAEEAAAPVAGTR
jgi:2',3'-cyclic-nucleotide 2'-phosphodiesterase (5'-nucleotidase family)